MAANRVKTPRRRRQAEPARSTNRSLADTSGHVTVDPHVTRGERRRSLARPEDDPMTVGLAVGLQHGPRTGPPLQRGADLDVSGRPARAHIEAGPCLAF